MKEILERCLGRCAVLKRNEYDEGKMYFMVSAGDTALELKSDSDTSKSGQNASEIIPYSSVYKIIKNDSSVEIILNDFQFAYHFSILEGQLEAVKLGMSRIEKSLDEITSDMGNLRKDSEKLQSEIKSVETAIRYIR